MRKKIIAGNWKMNYTLLQSQTFIDEIQDSINTNEVEVVICPNFVVLSEVIDMLENTNIFVGAQNVYFEDKGAYTGEISAEMLLSVGIKYCIVGHSERRQYFKETNEEVNKKAKKLLEKDIKPIVCVGETLEQRNSNEMFNVISKQIEESLKDIETFYMQKDVVVAYEPVWAIGTGVTATSIQAEEMCRFIRETITKMYGDSIAQKVRILYGGSVKPSNTKELLEMENIDGALVGGASLTKDFVAIVNYQ